MLKSRGLTSILMGMGLGALAMILWLVFGPQLHGRSLGRLYIIGAVSIVLIVWGLFLVVRDMSPAARSRHLPPGSGESADQAPSEAPAVFGTGGFGKKTMPHPITPIPTQTYGSAAGAPATTLEELFDRFEEKLMKKKKEPEKDVLTADEFAIFTCWNFDYCLRESGLYEYVYSDSPEGLQDARNALQVCGATEWGHLLAAYITVDSAKYPPMHAVKGLEFLSEDWEGMFKLVASQRGIKFDNYMYMVLESYARAKGLIVS